MNVDKEEEIIKYDKHGYRIENYDSFKPKKYYIKAENEEKLETKLREQENVLKQFKYQEDIPMFFHFPNNKFVIYIKLSMSSRKTFAIYRYSHFEVCFFVSLTLGLLNHFLYFDNYYGCIDFRVKTQRKNNN